MTYCVGLLLDAGIVLLSDTRTNAGMDDISTFRKMFVFEEPGERVIAMMTSGNLSVTQTVLAKLQHEIERVEATPETSIMQAETMLDVAEIVGRTLFEVSMSIRARMKQMGQTASASFLLGGQRKGGRMRLFHIYREGNFIEATEDTPFLQIGEHKYGKPILDRAVFHGTDLYDALKIALISMDSTMRSNLSVGLPIDIAVVRRDAIRPELVHRIEVGEPYFHDLRERWSTALRAAHMAIPA
nr:peptidase [Paracoccaceae bacterium]